jgi:ketosteroid isomerase-like protein
MGFAVLVAVCAALSWTGCGGSGRAFPAFEEMVETELAFSRLSQQSGVKTAFLTYLDDDGVVFRPRPVGGREWYARTPATDAVLTWEPVIADVSLAGDMGYTTGLWQMGEKGKDPTAFGDYVSVWRKEPGNEWRVVVDAGTVHAKNDDAGAPAGRADTVRRGPGEALRTAGGETIRGTVADADSEFALACRENGVAAAYAAFAADDICFLRSDQFPVMGKDAVIQAAGAVKGVPNPREMGEGTSRSDDLAYTYGTRRWTVGNGAPDVEESYLLVWGRTTVGVWKIVIDVTVPIGTVSGSTN